MDVLVLMLLLVSYKKYLNIHDLSKSHKYATFICRKICFIWLNPIYKIIYWLKNEYTDKMGLSKNKYGLSSILEH